MTVRNAIEWWHTSRNLPVPKFEDRRKTQVELAASLYEAGCTITEIAEQKLQVSITTVRKMLDEWFASKGRNPAGWTIPTATLSMTGAALRGGPGEPSL